MTSLVLAVLAYLQAFFVPRHKLALEAAALCRLAVALGTISFTVCFAACGLIGAFAPSFREAFQLSASETAFPFLVAVPVLLGSLARIPMGMLTDRFGGRVALQAQAVAQPLTFARIIDQQWKCSRLDRKLRLEHGLKDTDFSAGPPRRDF